LSFRSVAPWFQIGESGKRGHSITKVKYDRVTKRQNQKRKSAQAAGLGNETSHEGRGQKEKGEKISSVN